MYYYNPVSCIAFKYLPVVILPSHKQY